jgi:hypothetical protein
VKGIFLVMEEVQTPTAALAAYLAFLEMLISETLLRRQGLSVLIGASRGDQKLIPIRLDVADIKLVNKGVKELHLILSDKGRKFSIDNESLSFRLI